MLYSNKAPHVYAPLDMTLATEAGQAAIIYCVYWDLNLEPLGCKFEERWTIYLYVNTK